MKLGYITKTATSTAILMCLCTTIMALSGYSVKTLKLKKDWKLIFNNSGELYIKQSDSRKTVISINNFPPKSWKGSSKHEIRTPNFTALDQNDFKRFINAEHEKAISRYEKNKKQHDNKETQRHSKELKDYNKDLKSFELKQEQVLIKELSQWEEEKKEFDQEEAEELVENMEEWEEDKAEFLEDEKIRVKEDLENQKELFEEYEKKLSGYNASIKEFKNKKKIEQEACKKKGTSQDKLKCQKNVNSKFRAPKKLKTVPKPSKAKIRKFSEKKPSLKKFLAPKPQKSKKKYQESKPKPMQSYSIIKPKLDKSPFYGVIGITLKAVLQSCPKGKIILQLEPQKYFFAKAVTSSQKTFSPWEGNVKATVCEIRNRKNNSNKPLLRVVSHKHNLLEIQIGNQKPVKVQQISSPLFREFEKGQKEKQVTLNSLFEFKQNLPIDASYSIPRNNKLIQLKLEIIGKKKNIIKVALDTPNYIYDKNIQNKELRMNRVSLLKNKKIFGKKNIQLQKHYLFREGKSAKNWFLSSSYKYGKLDGKLENLVKRSMRQPNGKKKVQSISSTGLIFDFTSLWYLGSWISKNKVNNIPFMYFNDNILRNASLSKTGQSTILFNEEDFPPRKIPVNIWSLKVKDQPEQSNFYIGKKDHVLYRIKTGPLQIELKSITHQKIRDNRKWLNALKKKIDMIALKSEI